MEEKRKEKKVRAATRNKISTVELYCCDDTLHLSDVRQAVHGQESPHSNVCVELLPGLPCSPFFPCFPHLQIPYRRCPAHRIATKQTKQVHSFLVQGIYSRKGDKVAKGGWAIPLGCDRRWTVCLLVHIIAREIEEKHPLKSYIIEKYGMFD